MDHLSCGTRDEAPFMALLSLAIYLYGSKHISPSSSRLAGGGESGLEAGESPDGPGQQWQAAVAEDL